MHCERLFLRRVIKGDGPSMEQTTIMKKTSEKRTTGLPVARFSVSFHRKLVELITDLSTRPRQESATFCIDTTGTRTIKGSSFDVCFELADTCESLLSRGV